MEIQGQILEIIYQNEVNGYTIAELKTEDELTTIVGYLPFINKGDSLKLIGKFITHQEYGEQFKIDTFEKIMPQTLEALENYLSGGIIKGIGPTTAKKIVEKFGEETISILKFNPEKLSLIKGITKLKAEQISEEFNDKWELWQIVGFLEKFGISASNSKKVYETLGKDAIIEIEKNPYLLLDIAYGVDFKRIDKMAMDLGILNNDNKRVEASIKYSLIIASYNGHTCVALQNLINFIIDLIDVSQEDIEEGIINLKAEQKIVIEERVEEKWVYLFGFFTCEQNISKKIEALNKSKNIKEIKDFDIKFKTIEKNADIILSKEQEEAVKAVNENNVCIITGGPRNRKNYYYKIYNRNV